MISSLDILKFILSNKRGKVFRDMTTEQIEQVIREGFKTKSIIVDTEKDGKTIIGVALGVPVPEYSLMHVSHVLTIKKGSLGRIFNKFITLFPSWEIQAYRHDNLIRYKNFKRLTDLITT